MDSPSKRPWWKPRPVGLIAGGICIAGFALSGIDWGFIALVGVGTFGPGVLRELGWLRDKDEFQMEAQRRAGYHGFLAAGLLPLGALWLLPEGSPWVTAGFFLLLLFTPLAALRLAGAG